MNRPTFRAVLLLLLWDLSTHTEAQTHEDLLQAFRDLESDGVVMNLSAHPDDEDGATLAYYRMKYGARAYSVLFTRGEGGQNEKGSELYEDLAVLRSAETEEAGKLLGAEVRFLNFVDFGYSKRATEAFRIWGGKDEVLRRLVHCIRTLKPDIIFTNHSTGLGHGHHQAVAIAAIAAFDAAGDSTVFPEQVRQLGTWQPRKLFFRVFGRSAAIADVSHDIESLNDIRGEAYVDIANRALRMHKTQGLERADLRGFTRGKSLYTLLRANSLYESDSTTFFGGIDLWRDHTLRPLDPLRTQIALLQPALPMDSLLRIISGILTRLDSLSRESIRSPLARRIVDQWRRKVEHLVTLRCGFTATLMLSDTVVVPRETVQCLVRLLARSCTVDQPEVQFSLPQGWGTADEPGTSEPEEEGVVATARVKVAEHPVFTTPRARAQYGSLEYDRPVRARITFLVDGLPLSLCVLASYDIAPGHILSMTPKNRWVQLATARSGIEYSWSVTNFFPHKTAGRISADLPEGWRTDGDAFAIAREDSSAASTVRILPPPGVAAGAYSIVFHTEYASDTVSLTLSSVSVTPGLRVGIIKSYDTTLEQAVAELGVERRLLTDQDLEAGDLHVFNTILIDIRAYLVRDALKKSNSRLLDYARTGGHLVVMYQREAEWMPEYAPYPFRLSRKRICDEGAPVTVLHPEHPLFTRPNVIREADWNGWRHERAVYLPVDVPPEYLQLVTSHDPDEAEIPTGFLIAPVGRGSYIYTSYVWYRQLKDGNPGAFRCFANMLSYPKVR